MDAIDAEQLTMWYHASHVKVLPEIRQDHSTIDLMSESDKNCCDRTGRSKASQMAALAQRWLCQRAATMSALVPGEKGTQQHGLTNTGRPFLTLVGFCSYTVQIGMVVTASTKVSAVSIRPGRSTSAPSGDRSNIAYSLAIATREFRPAGSPDLKFGQERRIILLISRSESAWR